MSILITALIVFLAILHLAFLTLEMILWDKPLGLKVFSQTEKQARQTKTLAANQGLYNGFLAAGLIWGALEGSDGYHIQVFFLSCVSLAGIFGAATVSARIFWIQAFPAIITLLLLLI